LRRPETPFTGEFLPNKGVSSFSGRALCWNELLTYADSAK
jgi:hypothetical protein